MSNHFTYHNQVFNVGDRVVANLKVEEEGKTRIQAFEGIIISVKNRDSGKSFTIRKIGANNIGVERIIPFNSPVLDNLELKAKGKVRRAKLYYLRGRTGRQALRVKETTSTHEAEKQPNRQTS